MVSLVPIYNGFISIYNGLIRFSLTSRLVSQYPGVLWLPHRWWIRKTQLSRTWGAFTSCLLSRAALRANCGWVTMPTMVAWLHLPNVVHGEIWTSGSWEALWMLEAEASRINQLQNWLSLKASTKSASDSVVFTEFSDVSSQALLAGHDIVKPSMPRLGDLCWLHCARHRAD